MPPRLVPSLSALVARDVTKTYGDRVVLDGVELVANPGEPVGLVGENGVGKSTLLRLLAGVEHADSGDVVRPVDLAYLDQEPEFPDAATVGDVLTDALAVLHEAVSRLEVLASRLDDAAAAQEYVDVLAWAQLHDAWDANRRADLAVNRLGLDRLERDRPVAATSGGERVRLALAALVTRRPECVLLDEPTNHLDDEAMAFVEEFLASVPGVVVLASHDRVFLDDVCAAVVDLDPAHTGAGDAGGTRFTGGYTAYLASKRDARRRWETAYADQQHELDELRTAARTTARTVAPHNRGPRDNDRFIHHFKGQNVARSVSRRVRDVERRIAVLERERIPKPPAPLSFREQLTDESSGAWIRVRDLVVTGRLALPRLDVSAGERLLVTGDNGTGKSTLLKVVAGDVAATSGDVQVSARRLGYLPQEVRFARPERTAAEAYDAASGCAVPLRSLGLLHPRDVARPVGVLSLGQQRRLALAVLVARQPDLLLLDEPTNHISLTLAEELEQALRASLGTVVVASHDRWLRRRWEGPALELSSPPTRMRPRDRSAGRRATRG